MIALLLEVLHPGPRLPEENMSQLPVVNAITIINITNIAIIIIIIIIMTVNTRLHHHT